MLVLVVPTVMIAFTSTLSGLLLWRFLQGLVLPPIFAVTIAYVGEEWPRRETAAVAGIYASGASIGGFSGRFFTGLLADHMGWHNAYLVLAAVALALAGSVALLLPRERHFVRSEGLASSALQMLQHLRNPQLVATYAIGFGVLFNFIAIYTYMNFHLAAPPYDFSATALGAIFATYLVGSGLTPLAGRALTRFGRRPFILALLAAWVAGTLLTLTAPVPAIVAGLTLFAACGLMCHAVATGYVAVTAERGRSSAVGLYVTAFYVGGSTGAELGGLAWTLGGWPACVALVLGMLALMAAIVALVWR
jgi:predicted MFS family arabinose efflux permease